MSQKNWLESVFDSSWLNSTATQPFFQAFKIADVCPGPEVDETQEGKLKRLKQFKAAEKRSNARCYAFVSDWWLRWLICSETCVKFFFKWTQFRSSSKKSVELVVELKFFKFSSYWQNLRKIWTKFSSSSKKWAELQELSSFTTLVDFDLSFPSS